MREITNVRRQQRSGWYPNQKQCVNVLPAYQILGIEKESRSTAAAETEFKLPWAYSCNIALPRAPWRSPGNARPVIRLGRFGLDIAELLPCTARGRLWRFPAL